MNERKHEQTRRRKYNADFFLHDANSGNDPKIRALISKMGIAGYGMLFMLYEKLASADCFEISISEDYEKENLVSMLFTTENQFDAFIQYCTRFKLLILEDGRLFSPGLKKRLTPILERRLKDNNRKSEISEVSEHLEFFRTTYLETRCREYIVISKTSEISYLTRLSEIVDNMAWYILEALLITDKWYFENMSIKLLYTHYNQIISIIKSTKQSITEE